MKPVEMLFEDEARTKIVEGSSKLAQAVSATLGPKGRNVVIRLAHQSPFSTKDGVTVAKHVHLADPYENMGAQIIKEVSALVNDEAGDGTTTATVLANAILTEGIRAVKSDLSPIDLKRGMDIAVARVLEVLKEMAVPCDNPEMIRQVATISANSDETVGDILKEAFMEVDLTNGSVLAEISPKDTTTLEVTEGMEFDRGYVSAFMITDDARGEAVVDNVDVYVYGDELADTAICTTMIEVSKRRMRNVLIIANSYSDEVIHVLERVNRDRGHQKAVAVRAPNYGDHRKIAMEDIAIRTGGDVMSADVFNAHETTTMEDVLNNVLKHVGMANKVIASKRATVIKEGGGDPKVIEERIKVVKELISNMDPGFDRNKHEERLARLSGAIAVIKVGGKSSFEAKETKDRVDDALNATKSAVEEGILPGGGAALTHASQLIDIDDIKDEAQYRGASIIIKAITAPLRQIAKNAGVEDSIVHGEVIKGDVTYGYNAATDEYGNMLDLKVIDPAKVTRMALESAASVAGLMITTEVLICESDNLL